MIDINSFHKLPEKCFYWNKTIFRAQLKPDALTPYTKQPYYVLYYRNGEKTYTVTACGNIGQASELKDVANKVQTAIENEKNTKYTYGGMTVEHGVLHFHSRSYGIGMTDRSNTQDTSFGFMISDSLNKRMGKNSPKLNNVYMRKNMNMFTETEEVNFSGIILKEHHSDWIQVGENLVQQRFDTTLKQELDTAARKVRREFTPKLYDKLSTKQKLKKVHLPCSTAVRKKLDTMTLANNPFFDKDVFPYIKEKYNKSSISE